MSKIQRDGIFILNQGEKASPMTITCWGFLIFMECQAPSPPPPVVVCPKLTEWSKAYQARLADEIERLPPGAALSLAMREYLQSRDAARKCRKR
jgi:hypothetical protein